MKKIIIKKSKLLNKKSNDRRSVVVPTIHIDRESTEIVTLNDLVNWLFEETSRRESEYTHQCMNLFTALVKLLGNFFPFLFFFSFFLTFIMRKKIKSNQKDKPLTVEEWVKSKIQHQSFNWFINLYEPPKLQPLNQNLFTNIAIGLIFLFLFLHFMI